MWRGSPPHRGTGLGNFLIFHLEMAYFGGF